MPEWGNLVGKSAEEAKQHIVADMPDANVIILSKNTPCTEDYRYNRVRVFVDEKNKVVSTPCIG